jgi:hypothetical protein
VIDQGGIISVDIDGVLADYSGTYQEGKIGGAAPGAREFLAELQKLGFLVVVLSTRAEDPEVVWKWLHDNGLDEYVDMVTNKKVPFHIHVDDRTVCFQGDFEQTLGEVRRFKPWWRKARSVEPVW